MQITKGYRELTKKIRIIIELSEMEGEFLCSQNSKESFTEEITTQISGRKKYGKRT